jgi:hypothetical protein
MPAASSEITVRRPPDGFYWSIAIYATVAVSIAALVVDLSNDWDFLSFIGILFVTPVIAFAMLIASIVLALRRRFRASASVILAIAAYCAASWIFARNSPELHGVLICTLHSKQYKADVLAQPGNSALKHIDWYGWGGFGSDSDVYLAYDPSNSLSRKDSRTGRFGPLHCDEVRKVHRLQDGWYAVYFYTNEGWDDTCDTVAP